MAGEVTASLMLSPLHDLGEPSLDEEVVKRVKLPLPGRPVVPVHPVVTQLLHHVERDSLTPILNRLLLRPASPGETIAQILQRRRVDIDREVADGHGVNVRGRTGSSGRIGVLTLGGSLCRGGNGASKERIRSMATETFTRLVDDIDGGKAERTVVFSWDGKGYEIDLSKKNIAALEKALKPYVTAARKMPAARSAKSRGRGPTRGGNRRGRAVCGRFVNGPEPTGMTSAIGAALVRMSWRRTKPPSSPPRPRSATGDGFVETDETAGHFSVSPTGFFVL